MKTGNKKIIVTSAILLFMSGRCFSLDIIPANSNYYYKLNGGSVISMPPASNQTVIVINGDANTNLTYSCSGFNPAVSIANTFNNLENSMQGIPQEVIGSATGALVALPMYLLSKSNKDLYNLLENTIQGGSEAFRFSTQSCQGALSEIRNGKSPYQDWFSVSDSQGWLNSAKQAQQGQPIDINTARTAITQNPEQYGVPWVHSGQNSAGTIGTQVPIKVIYDVAIAGFNVMVDPSLPLDEKTTAAPTDSGLSTYFKTANDAGEFARLVLGDVTISARQTFDQTDRSIGLMTIVQTCPVSATNNLTCAKTIAENLKVIVQETGLPTASQLKSISSNELMATPALIASIRNKDSEDQVIAISKWAQDVAIQNIVDESFMLRRILIAGSQTNAVQNLKPALTAVHHALSELNEDIQNILFQFKVRQTLMTNTAETILNDQSQSESAAITEQNKTQAPSKTNGAVYKQDQ